METLKTKKWVGLATGAVFAALSATGCGSASGGVSSMIDNMNLKIYQEGGDTYAQMTSALNTGGLIIAGLDIPLTLHGDPTQVVGHIGIQNNFCLSASNCSDSELVLTVDLSKVASTSPVANTLPNGTAIPVGGLGNTQIVGLAVGGSGARVYVGLGQVAVLGVALPFQAMDGIGSSLPGVNIFQPFADASTGVKGIAGIFTGAQAGQSGFAVFVDATPFMPKSSVGVKSLAQLRQSESAVVSSDSPAAASSGVSFIPSDASRWEKFRLFGELNDLSRSNTVLYLQ